MNKLSLKATEWAADVGCEFLTVLMLLHQWTLGDSELGLFHQKWLQMLYPGYQTLDAIGVVIALVQGFLWPLIFAALFVWVYNGVAKGK